jgi:sugar lactone lactonase YvrE
MKNLYIIILLITLNGCKKSEDGKVEVVPLAPAELKGTIVSKGQVDLTWKDNSTNETGYKIERKTDSGVFTEIGSSSKDVTTFSDKTVAINTNYTYRVYSFNQVGKSIQYSNEVSIKIIDVPALTTTAIAQILSLSAMSGGNVTSDGGSAITARGVVWSTSSNPMVNLITKTIDGTGTGSYSSAISNLTANTTYFIRAYATNAVGTAYGNEQTFKTLNQEGVTVAGGNGSGDLSNQLSNPRGIFLDNQGNLYIVDNRVGTKPYYSRVQKWAPGASQGITVAGGINLGSSSNQLQLPEGIFVDALGNLYIADTGNNRIQKWAPGASQGVTVAGGNGSGGALNQLARPSSVFVDSQGNLYISEMENHRVTKWSLGASQGIIVAGGNGFGNGSNQFYQPRSVQVDTQGNIYVRDGANPRVQKWAPGAKDGITVVEGYNGTVGGQAWGMFLDTNNNLYIVDSGNFRVLKYIPGATQGVIVAGGHGSGNAPNQFADPSWVYVDNNGNIYVSDSANSRVQKWSK